MRTPATPARESTADPASAVTIERRSADSVVVDGTVEIVLLNVRADRAHIGIIAPEGVSIARAEIYRDRARDYLT
jgi:carbon storage regulator CsrA